MQERRIFGSGARRVEFYQVGPDSHVDELLIAYLPAQRLMFVAERGSPTPTE
ncbi:MAG: hypothetical protein IIA41_06325 [SAR324 cluster bacterium]|nr:hypothetical protein [SAR324 cluster bacterium]